MKIKFGFSFLIDNMYCCSFYFRAAIFDNFGFVWKGLVFILKVGRYILCDRILRTQLSTFLLPERFEFNAELSETIDDYTGWSQQLWQWTLLSVQKQRGKTSDWTIFVGMPPWLTNDRDTKREKMTSVCSGLPWSGKCKQNHAWFTE